MKTAPTPPLQPSRTPPDWAGVAARVALGLLFIVSGAMKASTPAEEFSVVIESYQILPVDMCLTLATFLPWFELLIGYALLSGCMTKKAAVAGGGLLLCFIGAIASTKLRGIELPNCGCFGMRFHPSTTMTLAMDTFMAGIAVLAYQKGDSRLSLDRWAQGAPNP